MQEALIAQIQSLNHEAQGVARVEGKTTFIDGALPFETVRYRIRRQKPELDKGEVTEILRESFMRVRPQCDFFGLCGGCSMQHLDPSAQVASKQRILEDNFQRIGKVRPEQLLPPVYGEAWAYRHRARLSVRWVAKKDTVLVGFHEKNSRYIADMTHCKILPARMSDLLKPLRGLVRKLSIVTRLPQIELACSDDVDVLVLRNMDALTSEDEQHLRDFADQINTKRQAQKQPLLQFWLQPKGPDSCYAFYPLDAPKLAYRLPEFGIDMPYKATEFTQVNPKTNQILVKRALDLLAPQAGERIADMFCGLGNFTLPIAKSGAQVFGFELSQQLLERAKENAAHNGLQDRVLYTPSNLFDITPEKLAALGRFDRMLIDPPRDGALALCKAFSEETAPPRLVYVSCNPATLARDAAILVHLKGYALRQAGIANMFPHTAHVESIALFEKVRPVREDD